MLKIVAVWFIFAPGMPEPSKIETPVATYAECQAEIGKMIEAISVVKDKTFKAVFACQITSEKADPVSH